MARGSLPTNPVRPPSTAPSGHPAIQARVRHAQLAQPARILLLRPGQTHAPQNRHGGSRVTDQCRMGCDPSGFDDPV